MTHPDLLNAIKDIAADYHRSESNSREWLQALNDMLSACGFDAFPLSGLPKSHETIADTQQEILANVMHAMQMQLISKHKADVGSQCDQIVDNPNETIDYELGYPLAFAAVGFSGCCLYRAVARECRAFVTSIGPNDDEPNMHAKWRQNDWLTG
jgi:hypothetical protein